VTAASTTFGGTRRSAPREFGSAVATIMVKELRSRMRGRRAFIVLTVYLAILALITYGVYAIVAPAARGGGFGPGVGGGQANASALIGQSIFSVLSIFQLILVCFIAPAFTSGQISMEREKQTLDLLVSTPMRPGAIVVGKLAAAPAFVVLMIVAALPISAIVLMYGGAAVDDLVRQQLVLLATALALGALGLFFSALLKRTQAATVLTYISLLALVLGTAMLFLFWSIVMNQGGNGGGFGRQDRAPEQLMYVNPMVAMLDVVSNTEPGGFGAISGLLGEMRGERVNFGQLDQFGNPIGNAEGTSGYWWPRISITFVVLALLLTLASMRLVVPAGMRWAFSRPRRRRSLRSPAPGVTVDTAAEGTPMIEEVSSDAPPPEEAER
jgi:ABC-2 type transport system permease protein